MFFRSSFGQMPTDTFLVFCEFLKTADLVVLTSLSNECFCLTMTVLAERIKPFSGLEINAKIAIRNELTKPRGDAKAEIKLANRVSYFLRLGIHQYGMMMMDAAEYGHTETVKMLYNRGFSFDQSGGEVAKIAASDNQGATIQFLHQNGFGLYTTAHFAAKSVSLEAIKALGEANIDFAEDKYEKGLSPLHKVLMMNFNESEEDLKNRLNAFSLMLKAGSFPKEGKQDFLDRLSKHYKSVLPHSWGFGWEMYIPMDPERLNQELSHIRSHLADLEKKPAFKIRFEDFKNKVEKELNKYQAEFYKQKKMKEVLTQKKMKEALAANKNKTALAPVEKELVTYRKSLF